MLPNAFGDGIGAVLVCDSVTLHARTMTGHRRGDCVMAEFAETLNYLFPRPSTVPSPVTKYKRFPHNLFPSRCLWQRLQVQQPLGISMPHQFAMRRRAIELLHQFRRHVVPAKRMVCAVEHALGADDFVAALQRFLVVADGVHVQPVEIVTDGMRESSRLRHERRWAAIRFDSSSE